MQKKSLLLLLMLLQAFGVKLLSQNFYEIKWKSGEITYTALVTYYSDNESHVRVKYTSNGKYTVAAYDCQSSFKTSSTGVRYFFMDGKEAKVVYNKEGSIGYTADNFYFWDLDDKNVFKKIYVIDDAQALKTNYQDYFSLAEYKQLNPKDFTEAYIYNFYDKTEPEFTTFLNLTKKEEINDWKYSINAMFYGNGVWAVSASENSGLFNQVNIIESTWPSTEIKENWDKEYYISSINGNEDEWAVVMSKGTGYTNQSYKRSATAPLDWIKEKWAAGYEITSVGYGQGEWCYVMSLNSGLGLQTYNISDSIPRTWIKEKWAEGYYITAMTFGNGNWNVLMSKGSKYTNQLYGTNATYPSDWIRTKWDKNYYISSIAYGDGEWCITMSVGSGYSNQSWKKEAIFPSDWLFKKNNINTEPAEEPVENPVADNNDNPISTNDDPDLRPDVKMHVIIVANTLDQSIGQGCEVDRYKLISEFGNIAEALNIKLEKTVIYGNDFNKANVQKAINDLSPGPDDIVVFFYRGHGFRLETQTSYFPQMHLVHSQFQEFQSMELEEVYRQIKAKGARLNIILGDMCNSFINAPQLSQQTNTFMQSNFYPDTEKLKKLFLQSKGSVISAAAKPGEVSWVHPLTGGLYTSSFLESLYQEVGKYSGKGDWNNLLSSTITKAEYKSSYGCVQAGGKSCDAQHGIKNVAVE